MSQTKKEDLKTMHKRGMRFLVSRRAMLPEGRQHTIKWSELAKLDGTQAKKLRDQLATQFAMDKREYLDAIRFAAAVETIVDNCGPDARMLLLDGKYPQTTKGIKALARTSDTRQRYRVDGVRDGRFRSVAPQNDDAVYDTVTFSEVPSRLRRGRGSLVRLHTELKGVPSAVREESYQLIALCREAAHILREFVRAGSQTSRAIPDNLQKDCVLPTIQSREVRGKITGLARQALRLTIKSVWDFPEMCARRISPTEVGRRQTIQETEAIIVIADAILQS